MRRETSGDKLTIKMWISPEECDAVIEYCISDFWNNRGNSYNAEISAASSSMKGKHIIIVAD